MKHINTIIGLVVGLVIGLFFASVGWVDGIDGIVHAVQNYYVEMMGVLGLTSITFLSLSFRAYMLVNQKKLNKQNHIKKLMKSYKANKLIGRAKECRHIKNQLEALGYEAVED